MNASDGYTEAAACPPPFFALIEIYAGPGLKPRLCRWVDVDHNGVGLYWRLTGIGRQALESA